MLFDLQVIERDGRQVLSVVGDVDVATLPRLVGGLDQLDADRTGVDLTGVQWFDPVCVGALIAARARARARGASFEVVPGDAVARMLADTGVDALLL